VVGSLRFICCHEAFGLGRVAALLGIVVAGLLVIMKLIPGVPGAFSMYEWIAISVWCGIGLLLHARRLPVGQSVPN
jgi:hypothetical protein